MKYNVYRVTYHLRPDSEDIVTTFIAKTEEEAIIMAKEYRKESFSIEKEGE